MLLGPPPSPEGPPGRYKGHGPLLRGQVAAQPQGQRVGEVAGPRQVHDVIVELGPGQGRQLGKGRVQGPPPRGGVVHAVVTHLTCRWKKRKDVKKKLIQIKKEAVDAFLIRVKINDNIMPQLFTNMSWFD